MVDNLHRSILLLPLLAIFTSCDSGKTELNCAEFQKEHFQGDLEFAGTAEFYVYGFGAEIVRINQCKIDPPIREVILPEGRFEDSIFTLFRPAGIEDKNIKAKATGTISCTKYSGCKIILKTMSDMVLVDGMAQKPCSDGGDTSEPRC